MKNNSQNVMNGQHSSDSQRDNNSVRSSWSKSNAWQELSRPCLPPIRILILMILSIFIAEIGVMFLLHLWPALPVLPEALIDAATLILILSPTFFFFHYRPMVQNLQQRELITKELVESEERLHLALQAVNDGLWDWNIKSDTTYYSPNCAIMLGYQPEDLDPDFDTLLSLSHPDDRDRLKQLIDENLSGHRDDFEIELRLKCQSENRNWLWVLIRGKIVDRATDGTPLRAVGTNTNIHERKQTEQALLQSEEGVRFLSRQLINTSEDEKKHLAQELHDNLGQMISAFKMGLELIQSQRCNQHPELEFHCNRLLEISEQMEVGLHEICDNLRPAMLDDLGLTRTLEWLINQFSEQHKNIKTRIKLTEPTMRLSADLELICYRVCQEALHNISKHARPTVVDVNLTVSDNTVQLIINDNGCGFDPTRRQSKGHWGIGLLGINERATAIGGSATIESAIGNGTSISIILPRNPER